MRTVKLEHMRPGEILEAQKKMSVAYIPLNRWNGMDRLCLWVQIRSLQKKRRKV